MPGRPGTPTGEPPKCSVNFCGHATNARWMSSPRTQWGILRPPFSVKLAETVEANGYPKEYAPANRPAKQAPLASTWTALAELAAAVETSTASRSRAIRLRLLKLDLSSVDQASMETATSALGCERDSNTHTDVDCSSGGIGIERCQLSQVDRPTGPLNARSPCHRSRTAPRE